jgi:hypothetical protein
MFPRRAAPTSRRARPSGVRAVAFQALLLVGLAGAWPVAVSATTGLAPMIPNAAGAAGATQPAAAAQPAAPPTSRALCPPAAPGYVSCLALIQTDVGPQARSAVGPAITPNGFNPSQLRLAYALPAPSTGAGTGITVAIIDYSDLASAASDLATYRSQFGLSLCTTASGCFKKVDEHGGSSYSSYPVDAGWGGEIALDIEMVSAICPNCHILLVEAISNSVDDLGIAVNTAVSRGAVVVSNSYGGPEFFGEDSADSLYFTHPGVAITVSSGDNGFGVQFPAASPHVTSVGGTSLTASGNARGWAETAWSLAGSGCAALESKPAWQADGSCSQRTVADVSADADPATGVAVYSSPDGGWVKFGGTSVASPIIAGVYALAGVPTAGTFPASYPYAQSGMLNDVTSGSNGSCGGSYLCTAAPAYDGPTGLGTPNGPGAFISPVVPGAPTAVVGIAGNTTALVSWHAAAANGHPITGYTVTSTPGGLTCTTTGTLSCTVNGLTNGTSYTFKVRATNSAGTGLPSAASGPVIPATVPGAPTGVAGTPADGSVVVSWTAPASNGGQAITGYRVTSSPLGRTCTTAGTLTCTVLGLVNGTPYTFTVKATNPKGTGPASTASSSVTPVTVPGATYVRLTPNRLVDSRIGVGLGSGLTANIAQTFMVSGKMPFDPSTDVPTGAIAVTGNLTVTGQTAPGYFALTQVATNAPTTSTLNFPIGDNRANGVTVPLAAGGTLSVTYVATAGATAHVIFDLTGYFVPDASGATYFTVTPNRLYDSRNIPNPALIANAPRTFAVSGKLPFNPATDVPAGAIAVTGNLTVTGQTAPGYFALTPVATSNPTTSTLNFPVGDNRANGVTVPLGPSGTLSVTYVATAGATAHVIFDVTGYFMVNPAGATYVTVAPNRLVDSRVGTGLSSGLTAGQPESFLVSNQQLGDATKNIPTDAIAITGNLTVTGQSAPGFFALTTLSTSSPTTSTLNFPLADNRANGVTVPLGSNGTNKTLWISYIAHGGATADVVFDVSGYFVP